LRLSSLKVNDVIKYSILNSILFFLKEGDIFGELSFFTGKPRETSALSVGYTKLYTLSKLEFLQVLQEDTADYV
jgi:CRP-like cAMP-binding protein